MQAAQAAQATGSVHLSVPQEIGEKALGQGQGVNEVPVPRPLQACVLELLAHLLMVEATEVVREDHWYAARLGRHLLFHKEDECCARLPASQGALSCAQPVAP